MSWKKNRALCRAEKIVRQHADNRDEKSLPLITIIRQDNGIDVPVKMPCWNYSSRCFFENDVLVTNTSLTLPPHVKSLLKDCWGFVDVRNSPPAIEEPQVVYGQTNLHSPQGT